MEAWWSSQWSEKENNHHSLKGKKGRFRNIYVSQFPFVPGKIMEQIFLKIMLRHLENKELTNVVAFLQWGYNTGG